MTENRTYSLGPDADRTHLRVPFFSMRGAQAGPRLVVTAPEALARRVSERLWDLASLGRMRGSLVLRSDAQDPAFDLPDVTMRLSDIHETDAYFQIIGRMADLGMIGGRGVPLGKVA